MVEAAGQLIRIFRYGLDYTFILWHQDAGRLIHQFEFW
jgi:hypothetical protein